MAKRLERLHDILVRAGATAALCIIIILLALGHAIARAKSLFERR